jgi:hypothetical protein
MRTSLSTARVTDRTLPSCAPASSATPAYRDRPYGINDLGGLRFGIGACRRTPRLVPAASLSKRWSNASCMESPLRVGGDVDVPAQPDRRMGHDRVSPLSFVALGPHNSCPVLVRSQSVRSRFQTTCRPRHRVHQRIGRSLWTRDDSFIHAPLSIAFRSFCVC